QVDLLQPGYLLHSDRSLLHGVGIDPAGPHAEQKPAKALIQQACIVGDRQEMERMWCFNPERKVESDTIQVLGNRDEPLLAGRPRRANGSLDDLLVRGAP